MKDWNLNLLVKLWCVTLCNFSRNDFLRYYDEIETSSY